ncbi:uncharacterized protein P884DRAFT_277510 [Thermothelomyces heterothallicus CBS 202.75]|uniref:uncharacterized protein n=1 Tax=Thermothelomyces heterothallicus CBS 202.75 TaxID=1149848 RepID=UPI003742F112
MSAPWEGIPVVGPMLGSLADVTQNQAIQLGEQVGTAASVVADAIIGKERKERAVTALPAWLVDKFADKDRIVQAASETVRDAADDSLVQLSVQVLQRWRPIQDGAADAIERAQDDEVESILRCLWRLVTSISEKVSPGKLLKALPELPRLVLETALGTVGRLGVLRGGILSNEINVATLGLVWNHFDELVQFFVDLIECVKCYAPASSLDGKAAQGDLHGPYNELDLSQPMNRHAVACQLQRLVKSVVFILKRAAAPVKFEQIDMTKETILPSDDCGLGTLIVVRPSGWQCVTREKWFFVNGIATELFWLHLACEKLAKRYSREVTGVFNRGDGILWDLIECAGERDARGAGSAGSQKAATNRTKSSRMAQEKLEEQLRAALRQAGEGRAYDHVVVIAHSQGCLLLRPALEELILSAGKDSRGADDIRRTMLDRLCVCTFGSPSVDWRLGRDEDGAFPAPLRGSKQEKRGTDLGFLSSHVLCTEHFANAADFVAKLGVLSKYKDEHDSGYEPDSVFVNREKDWVGHLFGTQYSLESRHYGAEKGPEKKIGRVAQMAGFSSVLLNCQGGISIRDAMRNANAGGQPDGMV